MNIVIQPDEPHVTLSGSRSQQLCVKLEPRGLLYVKLSLQEKWDTQVRRNTASTAKNNDLDT